MNENIIKVETYKGIDLFYNKEDGEIVFEYEGKEVNCKYVFEAKRIINQPVWEECNLEGYFKGGTFSDHIGLAKAIRKDIKSGNPDWKLKDRYDLEYKNPSYYDKTVVYPFNETNHKIYEEWKNQRDIVLSEERKLKNIIAKLSVDNSTS